MTCLRCPRRPKKPGWISHLPGSLLHFDVSFGSTPKLDLVFVVGHDYSFGDATVSLLLNTSRRDVWWSGHGTGPPWRSPALELRGQRTDGAKVTSAHVVSLDVRKIAKTAVNGQQAEAGGQLGMPPFSSATVEINFIGVAAGLGLATPKRAAKFKLLSLSSC